MPLFQTLNMVQCIHHSEKRFPMKFKTASKKQKIFILLTGALTVALMVFIFCMSQKNADHSSQSSGRIVKLFIRLFVWDFESFDMEKQMRVKDIMTVIVRKGAHFSEFAALGLLLSLHLSSLKKHLWPALPIGILYAVSDEIHQIFIPGRSCEFRDMCIDAGGILLGFLIVHIILLIRKKKTIS